MGLHFQTFYDSPQVALIVPSLQAMRRTRACVRPYHGLVPRFSPENGGKIKDSPENWGKIRKVLLASVLLANTLPRSDHGSLVVQDLFIRRLRVSLKDFVNSRRHHRRDILLPNVAETNVRTRAFHLMSTMATGLDYTMIGICCTSFWWYVRCGLKLAKQVLTDMQGCRFIQLEEIVSGLFSNRILDTHVNGKVFV